MSIYLYMGILLFCSLHLYPMICANCRQSITQKIGEKPFKGIFSILAVLSIAIIVYGWRSSEPGFIYTPPEWGPAVTKILMLPMLFLFLSFGNIKRFIRHPQLTSILLWAGAHLLSNGDSRSLVLFSSLIGWALLAMYFLNRRDGPWQKPDPSPIFTDIKAAVGTLLVYALITYCHIYISGVSLIHS